MPQIPQYRQQTVAGGSIPTPQRIPTVGAGVASVGEGLGQVAQVLQRQREQDAAADASLKLATAQSEWAAHLLRRQQEAPAGAEDFTPSLLKDYDDYVGKTVATAKSRDARQYLEARLSAYRGELQTKALTFEATARVADRTVKFDAARDQVAAAAELEPETYSTRLAEQLATLDALDIPAVEKEPMRVRTVETITARAAIGYVRRDPEAALKRMTQPAADDALFRSLTPRARDAVLNEIESQQRIRLQAEERAYRDSERAERDLQDSTAKAGDKLFAEGKLSAEWIEANKNRLAASDVRYFYRTLREGSGAGSGDQARNAMLYVDLRDRAGRGDDVRTEAREALQRGDIRVTDYDRLVGEVETQRPGWYKRGRDFISMSAGVSDLNPDPAGAQRKANMLDEWDTWAEEHPRASMAEAQDAYKRIVTEFAIVDYEDLIVMKRAPRFLVGSRNAPDFDSTEAETAKALAEKRITPQEAQKQALLIREWRRAYEAQTKAAPAAKGAK